MLAAGVRFIRFLVPAYPVGAFIIVSVCSASCDSHEHNPGRGLVFDKLVGLWQEKSTGQFEYWNKTAQGDYHGSMYTETANGCSIHELFNVKYFQNQWSFEAWVEGQNAGDTVIFKAIGVSADEVTFSNPAHDFPQFIRYSLVDSTHLEAIVWAGTDTLWFNFRKVP